MPRRARIYFPDQPQLIKLMGHNHTELFREAEDYTRFLIALDKSLELYDCKLHAYSLAKQEILFLLTPGSKEALSHFMQHLGRQYTPYYNNKYQRTGALWAHRYNNCLIEASSYFLLISKYVDMHLFMKKYDNQQNLIISSYAHNTGQHFTPRITAHECYLQLGKTHQERALHYQHVLYTPISQPIIELIQTCLNQNLILGTNQYCQKLASEMNRILHPHRSGRPRKYYNNSEYDWAYLENHAIRIMKSYSYQEIRLPIIKYQDDYTNKSTPFEFGNYSAQKFNTHESTFLRYEGTIECLRAIAQFRTLPSRSKLWYIGTMFRNLPSKGIEQSHQFGVEAFGYDNTDIELEHLIIQYDFFDLLGLSKNVILNINTIGSTSEFSNFRQALRSYYQNFTPLFNQSWLTKIDDNPEQLLSVHEDILIFINKSAPRLTDFISESSRKRFNKLLNELNILNIPYNFTPDLYPVNNYCHTLFEWRSIYLDNQNDLLCRGGRYDTYASEVLNKPLPSCGFAFMLDPIVSLIRKCNKQSSKCHIDVTIIPSSQHATIRALMLGRYLRNTFPHSTIENDCSGMKTHVCYKNAKRKGSHFILLVPPDGDTQLELTDMHNGTAQSINESNLDDMLRNYIIN